MPVTKAQALIGTVFIMINPETGKPTHFYSRSAMPAHYRAGKCKTWKRRPERWEMKVAFGGFNRNTRNYTMSSEDSSTLHFEMLERFQARERYGFEVDTPDEIIADRCRDDGDDRSADAILGIPFRREMPVGSQPGF